MLSSVLTCGDGRGHVFLFTPLATPRRLTSFLPSHGGGYPNFMSYVKGCSRDVKLLQVLCTWH